MLLAAPPTTSTRAPGFCSNSGATLRQPSGRLSLALAMAAASTPSGMRTSIASPYGTRTQSLSAPPQPSFLPPTPPYIENGGTASQWAVSAFAQVPQPPQEI